MRFSPSVNAEDIFFTKPLTTGYSGKLSHRSASKFSINSFFIFVSSSSLSLESFFYKIDDKVEIVN